MGEDESKYYIGSEAEIVNHLIRGDTIYGKVVTQDNSFSLLEIKPIKNDISCLYSFIKVNSNYQGDKITGINTSVFRIKRLDKTDIEDLGGVDLGGVVVGGQRIEGGKCYLEFGHYNMTIRPNFYADGFPNLHIYETKSSGEILHSIFDGKIRNKSELKQILKMTDCQIDQEGTEVEKEIKN